ncbi:hypothetical protein ACIBVL_28830 [Streptomyces sp. NPDC049687]|uniref:hypothetical protein n=1 Tax=Streptomyces sp. NPDC049687 TaxID=3365596 RepID=UPI00379E4FC5
MSEETAPHQDEGAAAAQPKGLLQRMEELMAALNTNLTALEDFHSAGSTRAPRAAEGDVGEVR